MLNNVVLMGRLTKEPELRHTANGTAVCRVIIAVERNFVRQGEERQADFISVVAWGKTAEFISNYFTKGRMIAVLGRIETRSWDDNGTKRYVTEIVAEKIHFTGDKGNTQGSNFSQSSNDIEGFIPVESDDDLPF